MTTEEFRNKCIEFANTQIDHQREGFKRMGIDGEWDNPYLTYKPEFEAAQVRVLKDMVEKGLIYKGQETDSLAEAVEYKDKRSPSIYVGRCCGPS